MHNFVLLSSGVDYGERAVALDDGNADAHKWFALLTGSKLLYEPNAEKIKLSYVYKVGKKFTRHALELTLPRSLFVSGLHQIVGAELYCMYFSMTRTSALKRFGQAGDTRIPLPRKSLWIPQKIVDCKVGLCTSLRTVAELL